MIITDRVERHLGELGDAGSYSFLSVGIDPGVRTGVSVVGWRSKPLRHEVLVMATLKVHEAMAFVKCIADMDVPKVMAFEDARERQFFGEDERRVYNEIRRGRIEVLNMYRGRVMGAGSVRRESAIWDDYLSDLGVIYVRVIPGYVRTKVGEGHARDLGWEGKSSKHSRDALMLAMIRSLMDVYRDVTVRSGPRSRYLGNMKPSTVRRMWRERFGK